MEIESKILMQDYINNVLGELLVKGEVIGRMSGDTVLIQDAMGEKVLTKPPPKSKIIVFFFKNY